MGIIRARKRMLCVAVVLGVCSPLRTAAQETGLITFDHYHTLAEIQDYLEAVTARHSELVTLLEIGADAFDADDVQERRTIFMSFCKSILRHARGMIVLKLDGWEESWGVQQEVKFCKEKGIPIFYYTLEEILMDQDTNANARRHGDGAPSDSHAYPGNPARAHANARRHGDRAHCDPHPRAHGLVYTHADA